MMDEVKRVRAVLAGTTVNLRLFKQEDLEAVIDLTEDVLARGEYVRMNPYTLGQLKQQFEKDGLWGDDSGALLITNQEDLVIGEIIFYQRHSSDDHYEIGYLIYRPEHRGQGAGSEAVRIFSAYLFALKPIERLQAKVETGNMASKRVLGKCGFTHEGTLRHAVFNRGEWRDFEIYSLLRHECPALEDVLSAVDS
jgi:RimJ/RimL family protein N-acetyltransferase